MKKVALFFGGLSNEIAVSLMSAQNVAKEFDRQKYQLILIYWHKKDRNFYQVETITNIKISRNNRLTIEKFKTLFDIALLMTHGRYGEDGVLQAMLESQGVKYCGCRVLGSALCMDKGAFKNILNAQGINQVKYLVLDYRTYNKKEINQQKQTIKKEFTLPLYVKPANSGSSVGITKVEKYSDLELAIRVALKHDFKVIIEQGLVQAREIEVAILGNDKLIVSLPGELKLAKDFYNYDDKYKLGQTENIIPAKLTDDKSHQIQLLAKKAYRLTNCQGFARVDFLLSNNKIYLNEINTLPGFTNISMYPMLMMSTGLSYQELINRIITLAY